MELIGDLLKNKNLKKAKTNKYYLIAEEIASFTKESPKTYLRMVKNNEFAVRRALDALKEMTPYNPAAYFLWLYKHYLTNK